MTLGRTILRHPHTGAALVPLGHRKDGRAIWPVLGGADDDVNDSDVGDEDNDSEDVGDDDDDADEDKDKDESGDKDDDDDKDLGPKGEKALKAVRRELRQAQRELRTLRATKGKDGGKDDESDEDAEAKAEERARELAKPRLVRAEARTALKEAGLIGTADRLLKLLDLKEIDVDYDDDGEAEIDGLDEQITDLKKDYPELFRKRGSSSIDAADRKNGGSSRQQLSASEVQARGLLGTMR